jgi:hypothetical protein
MTMQYPTFTAVNSDSVNIFLLSTLIKGRERSQIHIVINIVLSDLHAHFVLPVGNASSSLDRDKQHIGVNTEEIFPWRKFLFRTNQFRDHCNNGLFQQKS